MSGLVGFLALDELALAEGAALLSRMLDAMPDRDPGGRRGTAITGAFGLGVRCATRPDAPYRSPRGDFVLGLDGHPAVLGEEVGEEPEPGPSNEPASRLAEVLRRLYDRRDEAFVKRLDGAFSMVLWDGRARRVVLVRDRFGQKPMLVAWGRGGRLFLFASEAKALLASGRIDARLDGRAVLDVLSMGFPLPPRTLFEGIGSLPPGSALTLDIFGRESHVRWYEPPYPRRGSESGTSREGAAPGALRSALERGLARIPPGAGLCLDGGPEVTLLAQLLSARQGVLRTFAPVIDTVGRRDASSRLAEEVAARVGAEHAAVPVVAPNDGDSYLRVLRALEVPCLDAETFYRSQLYRAAAADGRRVLVAGTGAGALFASKALRSRHRPGLGQALALLLHGLLHRKTPGLTRALRAGARFEAALDRRWGAAPRGLERWTQIAHLADGLFAPRWAVPPGLSRLPHALENPPLFVEASLHRRLVVEQRVGLAGRDLPREERLAATAGLALELPFLTKEVGELAALVPAADLAGTEALALVRAAMPPSLGARLRRQRALPFRAASLTWPFGPESPPFVSEALSERRVGELGLFEPRRVASMQARLTASPHHAAAALEAELLRGVLGIQLLSNAFGVTDVAWK